MIEREHADLRSRGCGIWLLGQAQIAVPVFEGFAGVNARLYMVPLERSRLACISKHIHSKHVAEGQRSSH